MKKIRNAVRTFLLKEDKVVCIKNKIKNVGYYDIPGGKIENGETKEEAAIREFKEETGIDIYNPIYKGTMIIEYNDIDVKFSVFLCHEFEGIPHDFDENDSMWMDISKLLSKKERFQSTLLLEPEFIDILNGNREFYIDIKVGELKESIKKIELKYV